MVIFKVHKSGQKKSSAKQSKSKLISKTKKVMNKSNNAHPYTIKNNLNEEDLYYQNQEYNNNINPEKKISKKLQLPKYPFILNKNVFIPNSKYK